MTKRYNDLVNFLNVTVKSGLIDPVPIIREMLKELHIDPEEVILQSTKQKAKKG
jgi:hypothetical protein